MREILQNYIIPLVMLSMVLLIVSLRIRALGGPVFVFLRFFAISFGPSLVYAAVADDSSGELLGASLLCAVVVEVVLLAVRRARRSG